MSDAGIGTTSYVSESAVSANQAANTALVTHTFSKPATIVRIGAICVTGTLPVAFDFKLRKAPRTAPGTPADVAGSTFDGGVDAGVAGAIGDVWSKKVGAQVSAGGASVFDVDVGDVVSVCVATDAGATSTVRAFIEAVEHGYNGQASHITDA